MMKMRMALVSVFVVAAAALAGADAPSTVPAEATPEVRAVLKMLEERKGTLKDFTAKIDNSVEHLAGDVEGNRGTVSYINDPAGPKVAAHFTIDTEDGKPKSKHVRDVIFDGTTFTYIDEKAKTFRQQKSNKPVDTNSLEGPIPIPIGVPVETVLRDYVVTMQPSKDANLAVLRLAPRSKGVSEYMQLDVTVDRKLQLPVQVIATARGSDGKAADITTLKFLEAEVNTGKAVMPSVKPPTEAGWHIEMK